MFCKYSFSNCCQLSCCGGKIQLLRPILLYKINTLNNITKVYTKDFYTFNENNLLAKFTYDIRSIYWIRLSIDLKINIMCKETELYQIYNDDLYRHFALKQYLIDDVVNIISINIRLLTHITPYIKTEKLKED